MIGRYKFIYNPLLSRLLKVFPTESTSLNIQIHAITTSNDVSVKDHQHTNLNLLLHISASFLPSVTKMPYSNFGQETAYRE